MLRSDGLVFIDQPWKLIRAPSFPQIVHAETGKSLGPGESGELYVRGPALMRGYSGRPSLLATELTSWWKTGQFTAWLAQ